MDLRTATLHEAAAASARRDEKAAIGGPGAFSDPRNDSALHVWTAFASAASDEALCQAWLALQCGLIAGVSAGLLLLRDGAGDAYVPAAVWPHAQRDVRHLTRAAERALAERRGTVLDSDSESDVEHGTVHVAYPLETENEVLGAVVLDLAVRPANQLQDVLRALLWGSGWLVAMLRRRQLLHEKEILARVSTALQLLQTAQDQTTLNEAAIAVVNEIATLGMADQVSIGIECDRKLKVRAISRTAWFDPKTQAVETIQNAMEEAIDQEAVLAYPPMQVNRGKVVAAQRELARRSTSEAVLTVPLMTGGRPIGALALQRNQRPPFGPDTILLFEVVCSLLAPVFQSRLEKERRISGRWIEKLRELRDKLLGRRAPGLKAGAVSCLIAVVFLAFAEGDFRVSARTVIEGSVQRAAVAPFDGYIAQALARAGDSVEEGQLLAVLDDRDLLLERVKWDTEREQAERKYRDAFAKRDRAASMILAAQLRQAEAQLAFTVEKLARTRLVAPFDGFVVSGDLSQMLAAPVEKGKVLFELAPLASYRVVLKVDERDIAEVSVGQRGELALSGIGGDPLPFTVKSVTAVSTAQEGRNFFRVEAQLDGTSTQLRPGMEGVGKVSVGERKLAWIWTRNLVNWLRIWTWTLMP